MTQNKIHNEPEQRVKVLGKNYKAIPWIAGALLLLGMAIVAGIHWSRIVTVQDVHFKGYHFVTLEELEQQVDIPLGIKPDSLDYGHISESVKKIPYVKHADISVEPAGALVIQVTERKPLAMLAEGKHKVYVDADGLKLPLVLGKAVDVPILYGFKARPIGDTLKSDAFKTASDFLVEVSRKPVTNATISEVAWTETEGIVALTNDNGVKLVFGKEDFKSRLRNWEAFYAEVVRQKGINKMQLVDLRFQGQIVTRES